MRNRLMIVTAALALASASLALAQQKPAETAGDTPSMGTVSLGFQGSSVTGDQARFERYRDLRNRQSIAFDFAKDTEKYFFDVALTSVGNRDGSYAVGYGNKKLKFEFSFDSTPLNYGYNTRTPWVVSSLGSEPLLTLDAATRLAVQNKQAGVLGIPTTLAQWTGGRSVYDTLSQPFNLQSRRDTFQVGLTYAFTEALDGEFVLASHKRSGYMPSGAAFAFNNAGEIPLPIDDRTTEIEAAVDWTHEKGLVRLAYEHSWFSNSYSSFMWDNPLRATDFNTGVTGGTATGWDASAYSNGNGAARGRMSLAPDNSLSALTATGLYKFGRLTSLSGNLVFLSFNQDQALIPWTSNQVVANSPYCYDGVSAALLCSSAMPRSTAQGKVKGLNASFVFNTRPNKMVNLTARYRYNNHDNQTPAFDYRYNVRFDGVPEWTPGVETEPYTITQNKFDVDASFRVHPYLNIKGGWGIDSGSKTYLVYGKLSDSTLRASIDSVGNQYITLRTLFEHTKRVGSEFRQEAITGAGGQPNSRLFDDAERTRKRVTMLATVTPVPMLDATVSYGWGKDDYNIDLNPQFGLLNNDNTVFNLGVNVSPKPEMSFGVNYGREKFNSLQWSRTANPNSGVPGAYESWTDPNRSWSLTNNETVNNFDLYVDLLKAVPNTDIRINYTYSDSDQGFIHGGPRVEAMKAPDNLTFRTTGDTRACGTGLASCFEAFPNVTNKWQRLTFDLKYHINKQWGVGAGWWYEKFDVADYATVDTNGPVGVLNPVGGGTIQATGTPRIDYLGEISTGYGNRPYKGNTGFLRVFYTF